MTTSHTIGTNKDGMAFIADYEINENSSSTTIALKRLYVQNIGSGWNYYGADVDFDIKAEGEGSAIWWSTGSGTTEAWEVTSSVVSDQNISSWQAYGTNELGFCRTYNKSEMTETRQFAISFDYDFYKAPAPLTRVTGTASLSIPVTVEALEKFPVKYNSDAGPAVDYKYYGKDYTIGADARRSGYAFKEWNTQSGGGGTSYHSGDTYSNEAALELYPIFEPTITAIKINNLTATRVASSTSTTESDEADFAYITFDYSVEGTANGTLSGTLKRKDSQGTVITLANPTLSNTQKGETIMTTQSVAEAISGNLTGTGTGRDNAAYAANEYRYDLTLTFTKSEQGSTQNVFTVSKSVIFPRAYFPMDVLSGGHGIAFGKAATQAELLDVGYNLNVDGDATIGDDLTVTDDLTVSGDAIIETDLKVDGNAIVETDLYVTGSSNLSNVVNVSKGIQSSLSTGTGKPDNWISAGGGWGTSSGKSGLKLLSYEDASGSACGIGQDLTGLENEMTIAALANAGATVCNLTFAYHTAANPSSYTRLGRFNINGDFTATRKLIGTGVKSNSTMVVDVTTQSQGYDEGIRLNRQSTNSWADMTIGNSNGSTAGMEDYGWFIGVPPKSSGRMMIIGHGTNNAASSNACFWVDSDVNTPNLRIGNLNPLGWVMKTEKNADLTQSDNGRSSEIWPGFEVQDKNGHSIAGFFGDVMSNGKTGAGIWAYNRNASNTAGVSAAIRIILDKSGTASYSVTNPSAFLSAIGAQASGSYYPTSGGAISGMVSINPSNGSNYNEGLRINRKAAGNWALLMIGTDPNSTAGTGDYAWLIGSPNTSAGRQLRICHNSSDAKTYFFSESTNGAVGLHVHGKMQFRAVINTNTGNGTINLSSNYTNYSHMRIYFYTQNGYYASMDVRTSSANWTLSSSAALTGSPNKLWTASKTITFSGSTITVTSSRSAELGINSSNQFGVNANNYVYITTVEAWNE